MFNVLPDILKEEIRKEYRMRRLVILGMFVILIQIAFIIFIFPSWVISQSQEKDVADQINNQNNSLTSKNTSIVLQTIKEANEKLTTINITFEYPRIIPIFNSIISYKTLDISLRQFTYISHGKSKAELTVAGVSSTRESLVTFVKNLQKSGLFSSVLSPVSNLEKNKDINFVINLNLNKVN